jgi:hypothetical protein
LRDVDPKATEAAVLVLVVQGDGKHALTVQGEGSWKRDTSKRAHPWTGEVTRTGKTVGGKEAALAKGRARGIGLAIVVKPGKLDRGAFVPPSIEALTWCADFEFV